jgi:hypothetical protein
MYIPNTERVGVGEVDGGYKAKEETNQNQTKK